MATFLRFTQNAQEEIEKGYSFLKTPSMKKAKKLNGLCAFSFDTWISGDQNREMTESEIISKIKQYAKNQYYLDTTVAVLIDGNYLGQNPNGEGVIIKGVSVIETYTL